MSTLGDIMSTHWEDIMSTLEEGLFSAPGDIMSTPGRYHDKCGGRLLGNQLNLYGNPIVLNTPQCTHDIPRLVMVSFQCAHGIPQCTEHPRCKVNSL